MADYQDEDILKFLQSAPQPDVTPIAPIVGPSLDEQIKKATEERNQLQLLSGLGKAGSMAAAALSRGTVQAQPGVFEDIEKQAGQKLSDIGSKQNLQMGEVKRKLEEADLSTQQEKANAKSGISQLYRDLVKKSLPGIRLTDDYSAAQLEKVFPVLEKAQLARDVFLQKSEARTKDKEEKKAKEALPSDKQLKDLTDFDTSIANLDNAMGMAKSSFVGPLDSKLPDILVGGDEAAFRAAVGRMTDSYRKLITGAGAGMRELSKLESRLPQPNDTFENFKAKAMEFRKELNKSRDVYLKNLERKGKNVSEFKSPASEQTQEQAPKQELSSKDKQAIEWANSNKGDPRAQAILKLHGLK